MKYASLGILLQKHVSLRFLLFPVNKKIIETLPELQLCFLLETVTDPTNQREHWNAKEHLLFYSLHTFNIYRNSLDPTTDSKRQIARDAWKTDRSRNFLIFLQPGKAPNPSSTTEHSSLAAEGQGGMQILWPFPTWFLCWKPSQLPAHCSSGLVCARNTCLAWVVWLSPLWGLHGFPAASLRIWGLLHLVLYGGTFVSPCICTHRLGEYSVKPTCETQQLQKSDVTIGYNRFLSDVMGHSECASSN